MRILLLLMAMLFAVLATAFISYGLPTTLAAAVYLLIGVALADRAKAMIFSHAGLDPQFAHMARQMRSGSWLMVVPMLTLVILWPPALAFIAFAVRYHPPGDSFSTAI